MSGEFREALIVIAQRAVAAAPRCGNEESAKLFLVLPFLSFLGYDATNPHEVYPEHHADFSEKYKNRVDFAILRNDQPVIAIECKSAGASNKDDRGQLRSYFNAAPTVKMGVLTDGLTWEFFTDTDEPNMMDEQPFLRFDVRRIADGQIDDSTTSMLRSLHKGAFDPENIGAEAKRKHVFNSVIDQIGKLAQDPNEDFCRMLLRGAGIKHVQQKALAEYKATIQSAFKEFIDQQILTRLAIPKWEQPPATAAANALKSEDAPSAPPPGEPNVITTERELELFRWIQQRLAFLVSEEKLFSEIQHVTYKDFQGKFAIYYKWERKGRLLDFLDGRADTAVGRYRMRFPEDVPGLPKEVATDRLPEIDQALLSVFKARVGG